MANEIEHIEYFESRYKRTYDKYMQALTEFSVSGLHDEQILKAIAYCECQRIGKYLRDQIDTPQFASGLQAMKRRATEDIMNFGVSDRLPDISDRAKRIVTRDLLELLDSLITNLHEVV